jgi:hypothetical protein
VGKVYNLCRVKSDMLAVLTVKNGLDPHMVIEVKRRSKLMFFIYLLLSLSFIYLRVGICLYLVNAC